VIFIRTLVEKGPENFPAFFAEYWHELDVRISFVLVDCAPAKANPLTVQRVLKNLRFSPNSEFETADSADFADLSSRADDLCHLQFCSG